MKTIALCVVLPLVLLPLSVAQSTVPQLPCEFSGNLLRTADGKTAWFDSTEMKHRATHKVDVSAFMKRMDIKGTIVVDVLVGPSGSIVCVKSLNGHPIMRAEIEKALRQWTFEPAKSGSQPVAYLGWLEFTLCNISCGDGGFSMSILK